MTFQLQAAIKQAVHDIGVRFAQVETVTKAELAPMIAKLHGLVSSLPGEVEGAKDEVETKAKITEADVEAAVAKARQEGAAVLADMKKALEGANSNLAAALKQIPQSAASQTAVPPAAPAQQQQAGLTQQQAAEQPAAAPAPTA